MEIFALTCLLSTIIIFLSGVLVFFKMPNRSLGIKWLLFMVAISIWIFGQFTRLTGFYIFDALIWDRVTRIGVILIPLFFFDFTNAFLLKKENKKILTALRVFTIFFLLSNTTSLFISRVVKKGLYEYYPDPGKVYYYFVVFFVSVFCYGIYSIYLSYRNSTEKLERTRNGYYLIFIIIGFLGGATNFLPVFDLPSEIYVLGTAIFCIFPIVSAYAILKHNLLNIKILATEILVVAMSVILVAAPFMVLSMSFKILSSIFLFLFLIFGYYLIQTMRKEEIRREEAEMVAVRERDLRHDAEALAAELKRLDSAKTQFLLSTQHHLRSPLSVVQGYLSLISEGSYGKISAKVKNKVDASLESTQKLIHLVNDLLDVAHFQMNKGMAEKEPADAVKLIGEVVADLEKTAELKKIYLHFRPSMAPIPWVSIDSRGIREAVYNIVDNAIKYTQEGGVTVSVNAILGRLRISVADTGIGMNEKDRQGLFNRTFERGAKAKDVNVNGRGIGLYLASQMIVNNGGTIRAESGGWGKGSEFVIELPMDSGPSKADSVSIPVPVRRN